MENRSIKYQYWYSGQMLEVGSIQFMEDGTYIVNDELVGGKLREWTGVQDKNGKEIYEGDVIQTNDKTLWLVEPIGTADADNTCYGLMVTANNSGKTYAIDKSILKGEVVGNIYEDTDLY